MKNKNFEFIIASPSNREKLVCEIYYKNEMIAEISQEKEEMVVEIYPSRSRKWWELPLVQFQSALEEAKKCLGPCLHKCITFQDILKKLWPRALIVSMLQGHLFLGIFGTYSHYGAEESVFSNACDAILISSKKGLVGAQCPFFADINLTPVASEKFRFFKLFPYKCIDQKNSCAYIHLSCL